MRGKSIRYCDHWWRQWKCCVCVSGAGTYEQVGISVCSSEDPSACSGVLIAIAANLAPAFIEAFRSMPRTLISITAKRRAAKRNRRRFQEQCGRSMEEALPDGFLPE